MPSCSTTRRFRALAALAALAAAVALLPWTYADAARPLLDKHQWDAYFALFAPDSSVPWRPATLRLDTYSGAPVDFAAYAVDPADVIVAGQSRYPRPLDTTRRKPVVRWQFSPPPGYRFQSSDVPVPLGQREGFYVVEARRRDAVQQVWLNRTHIGLVTFESPEGLLVWGVDLHSGRAIGGMNVDFLAGLRLIPKRTDPRGLIAWPERTLPAFALAEHGAGRAFVSILPQAPLPSALVGLRVDSPVARAGETVRFIGFARTRVRGAYLRASGEARVSLAARGKVLASKVVRLDAAGAFDGEIGVPEGVAAGDYALLAAASGAVGGTTLHVDAASDVSLEIGAACPCDPARDLSFAVIARRNNAPAAGVSVHVRIVRSPHVVPPGSADETARWGTTVIYDKRTRTDSAGRAEIVISSPSDGLDSTYGVAAATSGATATTQIVVPNAGVSLALLPEATTADVGEPVAFGVRAFNPADGKPAGDREVGVRLSHGASVFAQTLKLNARGEGRAVFKQSSVGSNLALAQTTVDGHTAYDAAAVVVEPRALAGRVLSAQSAVEVTLDRARYRPGDRVAVAARASGADGDALVAIAGARTYAARVGRVADGSARATLALGDAQGGVRVLAALVRNGAIVVGGEDVLIDGPGHERATDLSLDKPVYAIGDVAHVAIRDGGMRGGATLGVRIADGRATGAALFDDAPFIMRTGATSSQAPASANPAWHAYVAPARSKASDIFAAERPRKVATEVPSIGVAAPHTLLWRVMRGEGESFDFPVPARRGRFVLSVLKIASDGDVGAASVSFTVE
ncbi:MAG: hypothetical protein M3R53_00910 [Candidatus Eremiobacteraeota bacterium]|nr:hypothetical protein [Candidatus Eremiobacteraeota bacterium]